MAKKSFADMTHGAFAMLRAVPTDGYGLESDADGDQWLTMHPTPDGSKQFQQYAPLARPGLHRVFGRCKLDSRSVQRFANEYGFLGDGHFFPEPSGDASQFRTAETVSYWIGEIAWMSTLLALWEMVSHKRSGVLGQMFVWDRFPRRVSTVLISAAGQPIREARSLISQCGPTAACKKIQDAHGSPIRQELGAIAVQKCDRTSGELLERWTFGDPVEPARYFIHSQINDKLEGHVNPVILPVQNGEIYLFPDSLLSALYVSFALEVSGRTRPAKMCKGCKTYFSPQHGRQDYHNEACRKLAYYHRAKANNSGRLPESRP